MKEPYKQDGENKEKGGKRDRSNTVRHSGCWATILFIGTARLFRRARHEL